MGDLKKLNEIIEDYINYLARYNPIFLNHAQFFSTLHYYDEKLKIKEVECEIPKMNATDTFLLVKEFFETYYSEEIENLKELFNSGVFNIYYYDELKEEKIYVTEQDKTFRQQYKNDIYDINLPLRGDLFDFIIIIHEIRHQLNQPKGSRKPSNDTLTETLSMFDELLAFDMLKEKLGNNIPDLMKNNHFKNHIRRFGYINFVSNLVFLKDELSYISEENYEILFNVDGKDKFISDCKTFESLIENYKDIDADEYNGYTFAMFLTSTMYKKYKENSKYLEKVKEFNKKVKNNEYITDCLKVIEIDLFDDNIINKLRYDLVDELSSLKEKILQIKK